MCGAIRSIPLDRWYRASSLRLRELNAVRLFLMSPGGSRAPGRAKTMRSGAGWMTGATHGESHAGTSPERDGLWGEFPVELWPNEQSGRRC
jgi:hypothetical protein